MDVSARILNAVNREREMEVSYVVTDASDNVLFTSTFVVATLEVLTTLTTVDLGSFDTTGFDLGDSHTVTIDWGDGSVPQVVSLTQPNPPQFGSFSGSHVYGTGGLYTVIVTVEDAGRQRHIHDNCGLRDRRAAHGIRRTSNCGHAGEGSHQRAGEGVEPVRSVSTTARGATRSW